MDNILISVIIPVYNAELYIENCVRSILSQSLNEIEILLIDDGSIDKSGILCDALAETDRKIRVWHIDNNGVTNARRIGVEYANGVYICFVDADDDLPKDSLKLMYEFAVNENIDILIAAKNRISNKNKTNLLTNRKEGELTMEDYAINMLCGDSFIGPHGRLIRRILFAMTKAMDIPKDIIVNEDLIMNLKLGTSAGKIFQTNQIVSYNYYDREGSVSKKKKGFSYWIKVFNICQSILEDNYNLSTSSILRKAFIIMKIDRTYNIEWKKEEREQRKEILQEAKKISILNSDIKRKIVILQYPKLIFFIKIAFYINKKMRK